MVQAQGGLVYIVSSWALNALEAHFTLSYARAEEGAQRTDPLAISGMSHEVQRLTTSTWVCQFESHGSAATLPLKWPSAG